MRSSSITSDAISTTTQIHGSYYGSSDLGNDDCDMASIELDARESGLLRIAVLVYHEFWESGVGDFVCRRGLDVG